MSTCYWSGCVLGIGDEPVALPLGKLTVGREPWQGRHMHSDVAGSSAGKAAGLRRLRVPALAQQCHC